VSRDEGFLARWSRRKTRAREEGAPLEELPVPAAAAPLAPAPAPAPPAPLPPVESLTPESDFAPFMQAEVDGDVKRAALKKLFADPRYNVMDGLDIYIDDYSKPDPLPEGWLEKMNQVRYLGDLRKEEPAAQDAGETLPEAASDAPLEPPASPQIGAPAQPPEQGEEAARLPPSEVGKDPTSRN